MSTKLNTNIQHLSLSFLPLVHLSFVRCLLLISFGKIFLPKLILPFCISFFLFSTIFLADVASITLTPTELMIDLRFLGPTHASMTPQAQYINVVTLGHCHSRQDTVSPPTPNPNTGQDTVCPPNPNTRQDTVSPPLILIPVVLSRCREVPAGNN